MIPRPLLHNTVLLYMGKTIALVCALIVLLAIWQLLLPLLGRLARRLGLVRDDWNILLLFGMGYGVYKLFWLIHAYTLLTAY